MFRLHQPRSAGTSVTQLSFCDADGRRLQVLVTNIADNPDNGTGIAYIEALHRGRDRAERQISDHKAPWLAKFPSHSLAANTAGLRITMCATTCSPRPATSPSTQTWPKPNPNGSATAFCTPPAES